MRVEHVSFDRARQAEMSALLPLHWDEVAKHKELLVLAPDWGRYHDLNGASKLYVVFAYDDGDSLIGYSANIIDTHIHYKGVKVASNDVIYVRPDMRNSSVGLRLLAATRDMAKRLGADLMLWHAKQGSNLDKLFAAKRLHVQDIIYSETL